jgi:hypothetical protein
MSTTAERRSRYGSTWECLLYALRSNVTQARKTVGGARYHRHTNRLPRAYTQDYMYHGQGASIIVSVEMTPDMHLPAADVALSSKHQFERPCKF